MHRSAPVVRIIVSPNGKIAAPDRVMTPGAFSWYHGATVTDSVLAQAKARMAPARKELSSTLSGRMRALACPAREQSSVVCCGV